MMSITHVVAGLHPRYGGPSRTVVQLTDALARTEESAVILLTQSFIGDSTLPSADNVNRRVIETSSRHALRLGLPVRRELRHLTRLQTPAIIHSHGLWAPVSHWAAAEARRHRIPLIVQPRGMLETWSLAHKSLKKRVAMAIYQRRDLETAKLFCATAESEYESIRALGFRQSVAVIPNGVQLAGVRPPRAAVRISSAKTDRTVLFLSRVHPKKGILNLLQAWAAVVPIGWHLEIAGPNESGHLSEVMAMAQRLAISSSVNYLGEIEGEVKSRAYERADLFVLPTFSENFGVVVAEALAHGVPVITTRGAPWADLETFGCGWWVDIGVEPLVHALRGAMALGDEERFAMGVLGREYVQRYDWDSIAQRTIHVYRWLLGHGPRPECVRIG